ncbi:MAG: HU family DNA-binding protein [Bacteroidales bacterium]
MPKKKEELNGKLGITHLINEKTMRYKVVKRANAISVPATDVYCAIPAHAGKVSLDDLAKEIEGRSSLTQGDILNVLENFVEVLPTFLKLGNSIELGDFGTMRLTLRCTSTPTPEAFTANHIKGVKIVFTPGKDLKLKVKDTSFERSPKP